jgi:hypothetical protein
MVIEVILVDSDKPFKIPSNGNVWRVTGHVNNGRLWICRDRTENGSNNMKLRNGKMTVIICSSAAFCSCDNVNRLEITKKFRHWKWSERGVFGCLRLFRCWVFWRYRHHLWANRSYGFYARSPSEYRLKNSLVMSDHLSTWTSRLPPDGFSWNFIFWISTGICRCISMLVKIWRR